MQKWVQIISSFLQKLEGFKLKSNQIKNLKR